MKDKDKTKAQLIEELEALRNELAALSESIARDITNRKQIEEAFRESERKYRSIFNNAVEGIFQTIPEGRILSINPALARIFGYDSPEDMMSSVTDIGRQIYVDPEKRKVHLRLLNEKGVVRDFKAQMRRKDRSTIWVSMNTRIERDDAGNPLFFEGFVEDITERKQIEEEIISEKLLNESIVNNIPAGVAFLDNDFVLRKCNSVYADLLRKYAPYTAEQALGMCYYDYAPGSRSQVEVWFQKVRDSAQVETRYGFELELQRNGQKEKTYWDTSVAPVFSPAGKSEGILILTQDVTGRMRAEAELKVNQAKLRTLASQISLIEEQERRRLAVELHDPIGQNLALAKFMLSELKETVRTPDILGQIKKVYDLINDAIAATRFLTFKLSPPVLYELGFEAAAEWLGENILKQHGIFFALKNQVKAIPLADDMRIFLFQTLRELMTNVIKHARAKNVSLFIQRHCNILHLTLEDDGIGFDTARTNGAQSFGHFSIRERMSLMGGSIEIQSKPGKGTKVIMRVPLKT